MLSNPSRPEFKDDGLAAMLADLVSLESQTTRESSEAERIEVTLERVRSDFLNMRLRRWRKGLKLTGLYTRASAFTRMTETEKRWLCWGESLQGDLLDEYLMAACRQGFEPIPTFKVGQLRTGSILAFIPLGGAPPFSIPGHRSFIAALFEHSRDWEGLQAHLNKMAGEMFLSLKALRRWADQYAAAAMAQLMVNTTNQEQSLDQLADYLRCHTRSDGVKVYLLRQHQEGLSIELNYRDKNDEAVSRSYPLSSAKGMADWVLRHNDWLLVQQPSGPKQGGLTKAFARCGEQPRLFGVLAREERGGPTWDKESSVFLYPLRVGGTARGVISIWRLGDWEHNPKGHFDDIYEQNLDLPCLRHVSNLVTAASQWKVNKKAVERKAEALTQLGKQILTAKNPASVHHCIAEQAGKLLGASRTLLFLRDHGDLKAFISVADWTMDQSKNPPFTNWKMLIAEGELDQKTTDKLRGHTEILRYRKELLQPDSHNKLLSIKPPDKDRAEGLLLPLYRAAKEAGHCKPLDGAVNLQVTREFLSETALFLEYYHQLFADNCVKTFAELSKFSGDDDDEEGILKQAARQLKDYTGADAALVYRLIDTEMKVIAAEPRNPRILGKPVSEQKLTLTRDRSYRILDTALADAPHMSQMDRKKLKFIAGCFGWARIRSWLCVPVLREGRCIGAFKLLTRGSNGYLAHWHQAMVEKAAEVVSWEMATNLRNRMLGELNRIAGELASKEGAELAERFGTNLTKWCRRFIQPGTSAVVFATVNSPHPRLFAHSPDHQTPSIPSLEERLLSPPREEITEEGNLHMAQIPVQLAGSETLSGAFFFIGPQVFTKMDLDGLREAAREFTILLEKERRRHVFRREMSMFRHALIGPVQGLGNAALELYDLAAENGLETDAESLEKKVQRELTAIRLWHGNQRLYTNQPSLVLRDYHFRSIIDRAVFRFEKLFLERGMVLQIKWQAPQGLTFLMDREGLDLVLSNLLDNVFKYSFYNREVELGVKKEGDWVRFWVEDVGHPIPEELRLEIFDMGSRMNWNDPIRNIQGTGLGLPMSKKILDGHEGSISCTSHLDKKGRPEPDLTHNLNYIPPYRVRFTVRLPFRRQKEKT